MSQLTVTDQFCGAGGSSIGATAVEGIELKMAINHWRRAIETHNSNFPDAGHDCADISQVDPRRYPTTDILITSPECTNHTTAKNHKQAAAKLSLFDAEQAAERSRATMWDVPRFAEYHPYKAIIVENVVEARTWLMFDAWLHAMTLLGYEHEIVYLNSMFCPPTPQSRDRMYTIFWRKGQPRPDLNFEPHAFCDDCNEQVFAVQSFKSDFHEAKKRADDLVAKGKRSVRLRRWGLYRMQYVYRCPRCQGQVEPTAFPAYTAIDWTLPSTRIGDRARPLADKTLDRIKRGIEKYGWGPALVPLSYGEDGTRSTRPVTEPFPTQTVRASLGLAHPFLTQLAGHAFERKGSTCRSRSIEDPIRTQTGTVSEGLVFVPFIAELRGGGSNERPVSEPCSTVTASGNHHLLVHDGLIVRNFTPGRVSAATREPLGAVTGVDHHGLLQFPNVFVDTYNGVANPRPVDEPLTTARTRDTHALIEMPGELPDVHDCYYRMLEPHEIQAAMAFTKDYVVTGNKREKVKQLGNAVTPPVMTLLIERIAASLDGGGR